MFYLFTSFHFFFCQVIQAEDMGRQILTYGERYGIIS